MHDSRLSPPSPSSELPLPTPVLVVEDEPLIQQRLARILAQLGYQPDMLCFASTLAAARQLAAQRHYALALVDLGLPDGNGTALIAALRAQDATMGILVISAWSTEEAILQALRAGATGYLLKERDDLEVMLSIRSVLRGGAPIDPFIARRVMIEFQQQPAWPPWPQPVRTMPSAPARSTSCSRLPMASRTAKRPSACTFLATPSRRTSATSTASCPSIRGCGPSLKPGPEG